MPFLELLGPNEGRLAASHGGRRRDASQPGADGRGPQEMGGSDGFYQAPAMARKVGKGSKRPRSTAKREAQKSRTVRILPRGDSRVL